MATQEELNKFKAYWEAIGKPEIEIKPPEELDSKFEYLPDPKFTSKDITYRIAKDPHWELRWKWIQSNYKLPIEWKGKFDNEWFELPKKNLHINKWLPDLCYREKAETVEQEKLNPKTLSATEILAKAENILSTRGKENGKDSVSERSFQQVADCFYSKTGIKLSAAHICLILQDLKDVRQFAQDRLHEDSIVDCVNYAALKGEELYKQYGENNA